MNKKAVLQHRSCRTPREANTNRKSNRIATQLYPFRFLPFPNLHNQESSAVAGKLHDATVNFYRHGVCRQLLFSDTFTGSYIYTDH